jgi:hypothetical protein
VTDDSYNYDANCRRWPHVAGPFPVGTVEFEATDPIRSSQYAPEPTVTRRLYVRAWYPAGDVTGCSRRPYFTEEEVGTVPIKSLELLRQPPDALRNAVGLTTNAFVEARPADGLFPVVVFNHGYLSYPAQHTALFEHLAANGYVVLSVGHPWESGGIVYPNGDAVLGSPRILEDMMQIGQALGAMAAYAAPTLAAQLDAFREYIKILRTTSAGRLAPVWRDDVYFVLDRLEENAIPAASSVAAIIDHERRGYMGKSYGAYIAGMLAQGDPRSRGVVHLDGGLWSYELADTELRTPFLTLGSDVWEDFRKMPELPRGMDPACATRSALSLRRRRISLTSGLPGLGCAPTDSASSYPAFGIVAFPISPNWQALPHCVASLERRLRSPHSPRSRIASWVGSSTAT